MQRPIPLSGILTFAQLIRPTMPLLGEDGPRGIAARELVSSIVERG